MKAERIEDRGWRIAKARTRAAAAAILYLLSSILFLSLSGCTAANAIGYKVLGPPAVDAQYVPVKEPMLVLVESYRSNTGLSDAEILSRYLMTELTEHKVAPLISLDDLYALRTNKGDDFRKMSIAAIGREAGAKQVLYVDVQQSGIGAPTGSELLKGRVAVQVRVVDVATGDSRWPIGASQGVPLAYETPLPRADENTTEAMVRQRMHEAMATRIARLFYKWKPQDTGEQLDMGEAR